MTTEGGMTIKHPELGYDFGDAPSRKAPIATTCKPCQRFGEEARGPGSGTADRLVEARQSLPQGASHNVRKRRTATSGTDEPNKAAEPSSGAENKSFFNAMFKLDDANWVIVLTANASANLGLIATDVGMVYRRGTESTTALVGCNLNVERGQWASLIGASGCGKSTLLRIFADIVKPTSGSATLHGLSPAEARANRTFALVSQHSTLLPWRKIAENVELGLEVAGVPKSERQDRAAEAIALVGLKGFERSYPSELSGGMRQRAAIARALTLRPRFLLMDEPFGALDELTREKLNFELLRILNETQATLLLVTHSISEAIILSDRVAVMSPRPGRISHMVEIDFGHDRSAAMRDDPRFVAYESELRHALSGSPAQPSPPLKTNASFIPGDDHARTA
jgi:NitT/TauT family transport system ATP-binding protein